MRRVPALALYGLGYIAWALSWPFLAIGQAAVWIGRPIRWVSDRCVDKAREWDARLSDRDQPLRPSSSLRR